MCPLANSIIKASTINKQNKLLNFGCCYSKLEPGEIIGISRASKKYPLPLSKYALTLATRSHTGLNWDEYLLKKKVKEYRYGIHLFIYYVIGIKNFLHVGDGTKSDYNKSFSCYVSKKLRALNLKTKLTKSEIQSWFEQSKYKQRSKKCFI